MGKELIAPTQCPLRVKEINRDDLRNKPSRLSNKANRAFRIFYKFFFMMQQSEEALGRVERGYGSPCGKQFLIECWPFKANKGSLFILTPLRALPCCHDSSTPSPTSSLSIITYKHISPQRGVSACGYGAIGTFTGIGIETGAVGLCALP